MVAPRLLVSQLDSIKNSVSPSLSLIRNVINSAKSASIQIKFPYLHRWFLTNSWWEGCEDFICFTISGNSRHEGHSKIIKDGKLRFEYSFTYFAIAIIHSTIRHFITKHIIPMLDDLTNLLIRVCTECLYQNCTFRQTAFVTIMNYKLPCRHRSILQTVTIESIFLYWTDILFENPLT